MIQYFILAVNFLFLEKYIEHASGALYLYSEYDFYPSISVTDIVSSNIKAPYYAANQNWKTIEINFKTSVNIKISKYFLLNKTLEKYLSANLAKITPICKLREHGERYVNFREICAVSNPQTYLQFFEKGLFVKSLQILGVLYERVVFVRIKTKVVENVFIFHIL